MSHDLAFSRLKINKQICSSGELSKGFTLQPVNIAITGYRDVCVCSHEGLVTGLASSEVQLTGIFFKKQLTSKVRSWSHQSGQNG